MEIRGLAIDSIRVQEVLPQSNEILEAKVGELD